MENITEFKEKTDMLLKKIYKVIDGNDIIIILSALWTAVEYAISQIDDQYIRNRVIDESIKDLQEEKIR